MDAEDLVIFFLGDDLYKAFGFADYARFARGRERELAGLDVIAGLFGLGFGQADTGHFRVAIGAVRHEVLFDRLDLFPGNFLNYQTAFFRSQVRQPGGVDHVADGIDVRFARLAVFVNGDGAARV